MKADLHPELYLPSNMHEQEQNPLIADYFANLHNDPTLTTLEVLKQLYGQWQFLALLGPTPMFTSVIPLPSDLLRWYEGIWGNLLDLGISVCELNISKFSGPQTFISTIWIV